MAKIKHNNFIDTVDEVITDATKEGIIHLYAEGEKLSGRKIRVQGEELYHFGTTGYLGLEQDSRLKDAAIAAIHKYGTQFPLSKTYISHPLYAELEDKLTQMYQNPVIITKNSTLGHIAVIPTAVRDEDAVILDHQVHWSVQNATQILKTRGIPVEMIRHNNLEMLEDKIKKLSSKARKIWYMADGVYSMFGDYAPVAELLQLCRKYPQLHLYFDDVHGMSWKGKNGTGFISESLGEIPKNMLLFGTLSKTFGASGAVLVCPDQELHRKIKNFGGPLTFSAQLEPASVAAALASADIHLSEEIYQLQSELQTRITHFNQRLEGTDLPLIENNDSPVFYIGTGLPATGYALVKRLMKEGFFTNLGLYPAVPVKNTGVRITISRHNQKVDIDALTEALKFHLPKAIEESGSDLGRIYRFFRLDKNYTSKSNRNVDGSTELEIIQQKSIEKIDRGLWNKLFNGRGVFDWEGLKFLESVFDSSNPTENNWSFYYIIVKDPSEEVILAGFFTSCLWKDDMLAPVSVSRELEVRRETDPYYMSSKVLSLGSLFTEGAHLYQNRQHPLWKHSWKILLNTIEKWKQEEKCSMVVLRDFSSHTDLGEFLHGQGFIKVKMPDSCRVKEFLWKSEEQFLASLSARSRRHFRKEIKPYADFFHVEYIPDPNDDQIEVFYQLYLNVKSRNLGLNTFTYTKKLFKKMSLHPGWEFVVLKLTPEVDKYEPVAGVMFCYRNTGTYVPCLVGMDYNLNEQYEVYRQLLYQTVVRAGSLNLDHIDFGFSASFEKRKLGAKIEEVIAFVQADDNYSMEVLGTLQNEGPN